MDWRRATTGREFSEEAKIDNRNDLEGFLEEIEAELPSKAEKLIYNEKNVYGPFEQELPEEEKLKYEFKGTVTVLNTSIEEFTAAANGGDLVEVFADGKISIQGDEYEDEFRLREFYESPATKVFHWDYSDKMEELEVKEGDAGLVEVESD